MTEAATRTPDAPALITVDRTVVWSELERMVRAVAGGLAARGLVPGDRVAMLVGNSVEFVSSYFGVLRAGLVAVPINTGYTVYEVRYQVEQSGAALLICEEATATVAREASGEVPVVTIGSDAWRSLTVGSTPPPELSGAAEDLAVLLFTSGTSGRPKGAMLSHRALFANLDQLTAVPEPAPMLPDDVVLLILPLFHSYALNAVLGMLAMHGAAAVLPERFDPVRALAQVKRHGVTVVATAPPVYQAWSELPRIGEALAGVRMMLSGAAPLTRELHEAFTAATGLPVWEGYGMTEASPVVTSTIVSGRPKPGSVGQPLPGVEVKLCDEEGHEVDEGDPGEVVVRGPNLFSGYWPDGHGGPDDEGWWATADVAIFDHEGDLQLVDRRNDLIIVSGFNVYPREVEEALFRIPGVREAAVMGVASETTGEAVKAILIVEDDVELDAEAVIAACRTRLARFKCPTLVEFVTELPHSGTGKISKGVLRERIAGLRE
ncbi:MAG: long-chain acyl-CoA synthetase [Actinomycetota bacterium]|nr:long-chain acyl-CoA synthetase [Actinomycetota bacterium]